MNIYLSAHESSTSKDTTIFYKGAEILKSKGHNIFFDRDYLSNDYFKSSLKAFRNASILIIEVSNADAKVGIEISKALADKKVVIAMHNSKSLSKNIASLAQNNKNSLFLIEYNNDNVEKQMNTAFEKAKKLLDTKFILIITPEIDKYLSWASENKRMHKAQVVRDAVEKVMSKDKDYKKVMGK